MRVSWWSKVAGTHSSGKDSPRPSREAVSAPALITARAVAGLAAAGCFVVVPVYVKEIAEDAWRGALASLTMTICKLGVIFVYAVGMFLPYGQNQAVYLSVAAVHVVLFSFMPESPNYLLKNGREKPARSDVRVRDKATFSALRVTLMLMALQTLSGCFALMNYASDVFARTGAAWSADGLALLMGSLQLAGSFFTTHWKKIKVPTYGNILTTSLYNELFRQNTMAKHCSVHVCVQIPLGCSSGVVSVCMAALATYFATLAGPAWLPVAAVCLCILAYGAGLAPVPMVIMAEVFSFQSRPGNRAHDASTNGRSINGAIILLQFNDCSFLHACRELLGPYVVFYVFAAVTLWGVLYTILWVPETKGKSLAEIQAYWVKPEPVFV
ncbi:hypothetical protein MSG28_013763 [Choristoneura fumiferana]|uniref:Uncharacterized protein n=2 Tax=Choristoneura fumiferana TaxID=7141 RepID=A0ACC0K8P1_CHOFU|nr:hypothetical protein MSG28_013763 [Choristoneura fumiferana]KAI8432829.1 hypothetical protein MSG28_013763 [Choristoneura fumiferana]